MTNLSPSVIPMELVSSIPETAQPTNVPTLAQAGREYVAEMVATGYSKTMVGGAARTIGMFELWLKGRQVSRATALGFRQYLDTHPTWSGGTSAWHWGNLARFLDWLVIAGYTQVKIASHIRAPTKKPAKHKKAALNEHVYRRILEVEKSPVNQWLYKLMWNTGMAIGDAATLQWREVDMGTATISRVRMKTKAEDRPCVIPIQRPGELWDALVDRDKLRESEQDRYPNINGKCYVHPQAWLDWESHRVQNRWAYSTSKAAGVVGSGISLHSFRRGFISRMAKGGINPFVGCQITGHKDPKIFQHYVQTDHEFIRNEVERALTEAAQRK